MLRVTGEKSVLRIASARGCETSVGLVGDSMRICVLALLLAVSALVAGSPASGEDLRLVDFELQDQFKKVHRRSDVQGSIVVLIGSDKGGSQFNQAWGNAIHDSLSGHPAYDEISHLAHADLRGLPFFLKGVVRRKFPDNPDQWVLMDWKGIIAEAYDFAPKSSNVLVFAPDGTLVHHAIGREVDDGVLERLVTALLGLLDEAL